MQTLPLLATLALLSCSTPPSSQPVSLSPTLYADAPVSAASGAESTTPNTSHAAAPKANQPSPVAGAALGDTADQVSRGLVPVAAGMPASTSAFVDRGATFEATVTSTDGTFKWIVNKAPKHPFALVAIEDAGNLIEPMHGAILADDGKIDSVPPKVVLMQASGQRLIVEYASGLRLELAPKGRALLIYAAQKTGKRTQGQLDFSQGGRQGQRAQRARVVRAVHGHRRGRRAAARRPDYALLDDVVGPGAIERDADSRAQAGHGGAGWRGSLRSTRALQAVDRG